MLCGNKKFLEELIGLGIKQICDSRIENLKTIKSISPTIETIFIKPPAKRNAAEIVEYADISFNTKLETIKLLSDAARTQSKCHKIIIVVDLGNNHNSLNVGDLVEFSMDYMGLLRLMNSDYVTSYSEVVY